MSIEPLLDLRSLDLRDPLLVGAFMGWADASVGASGAVRFLIESLDAERLATWDGDDYYDFVELRPVSDRKSTRLNSSHSQQSRMPSSA